MTSVWDRGGIFISYRREDTAAQAGPLYDRLSARFGQERVFMDVDSIAFGVDFTERVIGILAGCNVLLALIGREWSAITDSKGTRRLDNPLDWVRVEIETALQRDIRVVPVLVDGAVLPQAADLPSSLRPLIQRQASKLSHTSFESDVTRLIADVHAVIERRQSSRLTVTRIYAPAVDVPALAKALRVWYENQGLEAILVTTPTALIVQCRARKRSERASGMSALLTVILQDKGEDLCVEIGSAKWLGTANTAKATAAGVGLAAASSFMPLAWPVTAGAAAVVMGSQRWRQYRLSNQTISFLRETAPTHVRGA
jgi:hypothetical protein